MKKFKDAFRGITEGIKHKSIAVQFVLGILAVIAGIMMKLDTAEWIAVLICTGMVISTEMLNTCVEKLCDLYTSDFNETIRDIKDIAAGAVLCASLAALAVAFVILLRHI